MAGEPVTEIFVAPGGDDGNAGTKGKPFATPARARDAARAAVKKGPVRVVLGGGTYRLAETLVLGPEDSGTMKRSVTWTVAPGKRPVLSGGRVIKGWKKTEGGVWTTEVPGVKDGKWNFRQLYVNGARRTRARTPNSGYFRIVKAGPDGRTSFTFRKGDMKKYGNPGDAEVVFIHDWCTSRVNIADVDEGTSVATFTDPIGGLMSTWSKMTHFEKNPRYYVENARELLDTPGEWYLDRKAGVLSYVPLPDEDMSKAEVVAPVLVRLLEIRGGEGKPVTNLTFQGITFAHAGWLIPEFGFAAAQAAFYEKRSERGKPGKGRVRVPCAVEFEEAVSCVVRDCRFLHLGGCGLGLRKGSHKNHIVGCELRDISGNGVMIGEGSSAPKMTVVENVVSNNLVHFCGQEFPGSIGVWAGITDGTVIGHNEIANLPYTGVSVGWSWNTNPTPCRQNIIEHNHIHHVMQKLSDGGGIYTLGRQPGTVLRGNHIHSVPANSGRAESNGMFLDEGTSEIVIENNVIRGVTKSPLRFHKATTNTIRNNTLALSPGSRPYTFNACSKETMTFENDTVIPAAGESSVKIVDHGRVGSALECDGVRAGLDVPHDGSLEPEQMTLEAWINMPAYPSGVEGRRWIANKNANEWEEGHYGLVINEKRAGAYLNIGGGRWNGFAAWAKADHLKLKQWHHLALTYDGKDLKVYADGKLAGSEAVNKKRVPGRGGFAIGKRQDNFIHFEGLLDEVALYRRALSADEIQKRFEKPGPAKDKDLVRRWGFEEKPGGGGTPDYLGKIRETAGLEPEYRKKLLEK